MTGTAHRRLYALLVTGALLFGATAGAAQTNTDSTAGRIGRADSSALTPGDSIARPGIDTSAGASAATSSGNASVDSKTPAAVAVALPVDTVLVTACKAAPVGTPAPGLLSVTFRAGTTELDRVTAAREVSGELAGVGASGEQYIRLSPDAGPVSQAAARLIRLGPITSVSEKPCPSLAPSRP